MKWKAVSIVLVLICFGIGIVFWPGSSSKQVLPDGTLLVLSGLKIGRTNVYAHGTWLSKIVGRFAPAKGITVAGLKLQPPEKTTFTAPVGSEILSAQIALLPGSPRENAFLTSPRFSRKFRLLISGDEDWTFVREFNGFRKQADGIF